MYITIHQERRHNIPKMEEKESEKPIKAGIITGVTQSRAEFLRTATPLAVVAALGIPLSSCGVTDSGDDSDTNVNDDNDNTDDSNNNNGGGNSASAFSVEGNTITIDTSVSGGEALASAGGWLIASEYGFLAINIDGARVRAFSDVCTHASCRNAWQFSNSTFICTCHNSVFNSSGEVVSGPADSPLPEYSASKNGDIIRITKG
jgi:cytochrome b6-f complex iron-sulfur subunit